MTTTSVDLRLGVSTLEADVSAEPREFRGTQPPAHSPVELTGLSAALLGTEAARSRLEALLQREYSASSVVLTDSGTTALAQAIRLARKGIGEPGAPIALPAYGCFAIATAAVEAGGPYLFYDVDPRTLGPDSESLEACLVAGARVVVVASLFGQPVDWDAVLERTSHWGALTIEDAAQGHGGSWRGRPVGAWGDLGVLSFGRGKGWTGGGGGALVSRRDDFALGSALPELGAGRRGYTLAGLFAQWALARPGLYAIPSALPWLGLGRTEYRDPWPAAQMTRGSAAAALANRSCARLEIERRRANAEVYRRSLAGTDLLTGQDWPHACNGYLRFPVLLRPGSIENDPRAMRLGIYRSYPAPLPELPALVPLRAESNRRYPGAARLAAELATLPTHSWISPAHADAVARLVCTASGCEVNDV